MSDKYKNYPGAGVSQIERKEKWYNRHKKKAQYLVNRQERAERQSLEARGLKK